MAGLLVLFCSDRTTAFRWVMALLRSTAVGRDSLR